MRAVIMGNFLSLDQHFSVDLIPFKCDYIWVSDCQGNISGNLFCLFTSHSFLHYSWALVGDIVAASPYASCIKWRFFPNLFFSFLITHALLRNRGYFFFFNLRLPWTWLVLNEWRKPVFKFLNRAWRYSFVSPHHLNFTQYFWWVDQHVFKKSQHNTNAFRNFPEESRIFSSGFPFVLLLNMHHIAMMLFIFHWDKPFNTLYRRVKPHISRMQPFNFYKLMAKGPHTRCKWENFLVLIALP